MKTIILGLSTGSYSFTFIEFYLMEDPLFYSKMYKDFQVQYPLYLTSGVTIESILCYIKNNLLTSCSYHNDAILCSLLDDVIKSSRVIGLQWNSNNCSMSIAPRLYHLNNMANSIDDIQNSTEERALKNIDAAKKLLHLIVNMYHYMVCTITVHILQRFDRIPVNIGFLCHSNSAPCCQASYYSAKISSGALPTF